MSVSKTWKFTEFDISTRSFYENLDANVIVFGEEICPSTGKRHYQGHVVFKRAYRLSALKKLSNAHWEPAKCDDFNYELKGENVFIRDNRKKKGERSDLISIADKAKSGATIKEIAEEFPSQFIRYHKGIERLHEILNNTHEKADYSLNSCCEHIGLEPLKFDKTQVIVGEAGCGKTQYALAHFEKPCFISHIDGLKKFDPKHHDGIVFDDMDFKHYHRTHQIHLTDWNNTRDIHCRFINATIPKHTKKVFLCNEYCFTRDPAIDRRVTVTEVTER